MTVKRSRADALVRRAYQMIEDAMLAANRNSARFFAERRSGRSGACIRRRDAEPLTPWPSWRRALAYHRSGSRDRAAGAADFLGTNQRGSRVSARCPMVLRSTQPKPVCRRKCRTLWVGSARISAHLRPRFGAIPTLVVHRLLKLILRQEGEPAGKVLGAWPPRKDERVGR